MKLTSLFLSSLLPGFVGAVEIHVSPTGEDAADGMAARPVKTLMRARDLLRERRQGTGGGTVLLHAGEYAMTETLALTVADGGADAGSPVVWKAAGDGRVTLSGGLPVGNLYPADGDLPTGTLVADVRAQGYGEMPAQECFGFYDRSNDTSVAALYCDGAYLTVAREPNEGRWLWPMDLPVEGATNVVRILMLGPERLTRDRAPDLMARGYWKNFWADEFVRAEMTDAEDGRVTFFGGPRFPGTHPHAKFYFFNALSILDRPGEWFLDRKTGRLYVLPPVGVRTDAAYVLSRFRKPFLAFEGASHVVFEGFELAYGCGAAIVGKGGTDITLRGNAVHDFGGWALDFDGTDRLTVHGNVFDGFGMGGLQIRSGDRKTLTSGRTRVTANDIGHTGRTQHTYTGGLNYGGCGLVAAQNRLHDISAHGANLRGNDILFASNVVERVSLESDDQGGTDTWGDISFREIRFVHNIFRDIGSRADFASCGAGGVRLDDAVSGQFVYGNRFIRCATGNFGGVQVNGGLENRIDNNLFVGCKYAVSFMYPFTSWWWDIFLNKPQTLKRHHEDVEILKPPYSARYPQLLDWPRLAKKNLVTRNVAVGAKELIGPEASSWECVCDERDNLAVPSGTDGEAEIRAHGFDALPPVSALGLPADDLWLKAARMIWTVREEKTK